MRYRTLRHWDDPNHLQGLAFFTQLLEELLFDYSLDTYKPSAMNTSILCKEALDLIIDIEDENIDANNLEHVIKEFLFCLNRDEIAKSLLDVNPQNYSRILSNETSSLNEKRVVLEIIESQIHLDLYKNKAEELLFDAIQVPTAKSRIRALTRDYVTTLIRIGYR